MTANDIRFAKGPSESAGHFYDQHGNQVESVPYARKRADGATHRKPTLRDARKHDWCPGVTTIIREMAAPGLERWKRKQVLMAALTLTRQPDETDDAFVARVEADADEQARAAAEEGTNIHAAVESFYRGDSCDARYTDHVRGVEHIVDVHCYHPDRSWLPEKGVTHRYGYGTKVDLHSDAWLLDFKSADGDVDELRAKGTWDNHAMQLAAGREALGGQQRCAIVYVSRTHPGACHIEEVTEDKLQRGWRMFCAALRLWQERTGHVPAWVDAAWKEAA